MARKLFIICSGQTTTSRVVHLQKITELARPFFEETVITSEDLPTIVLRRNESRSFNGKGRSHHETDRSLFVLKVLRFVKQEIEKSRFLFSHVSNGDIALFLGIYQPLSMLAVKLRKGLPVLFGGGFDVSRFVIENRLFDALYFILRWSFQVTMLRLSEAIIVESSCVKNRFNLGRFERKIFDEGNLFTDDKFAPINPIGKRDVDVAYIGALSLEKGIVNFLDFLRIAVKIKPVNVLVVGDGQFRDMVMRYSNSHDLQGQIKYQRHVEYQDMPSTLNRVKLLVIPSYSEGLPNILLEAMACGTPVLATPVGAIPDVIKENQTGFLLRSNDPEHISQKVIWLLENPKLLGKISSTAYAYARENFGYEKTLEKWRRIFSELSSDKSIRRQSQNQRVRLVLRSRQGNRWQQ